MVDDLHTSYSAAEVVVVVAVVEDTAAAVAAALDCGDDSCDQQIVIDSQ